MEKNCNTLLIPSGTVTKGRDRPTQTTNPCFCMPSYNAVFRLILLLVNLLWLQYTLEVYTVTKDSPQTNLISHSGPLHMSPVTEMARLAG